MSLFTHQKKRISREQSKNTLLVKRQSVNHYPGAAWWMILLIRVITAIHTARNKRIIPFTDKWKNSG